MRIALISDIHGNYIAFESVLADIDRQHIDSVVCLGDVATIGPQPRQVLDKLKELGCACIRGNHESALLEPEKSLDFQISASLLSTLDWCSKQLTKDDFDFIRSFKSTITVELGLNASMLCFHGTPQSNTGLILATTSGDELDNIFGGQSAIVLAGGHSHIQMIRQHKGKFIVNAGSVGNAFYQPVTAGPPSLLPWAEYAIVELSHGNLSVQLRRISFDITRFKKIISDSDIPFKDSWLEQY